MASKMTTKDFFATANSVQFDFALAQYDKALRLKAEAKNVSKPENVIKLDKWYQNELPKKIKSRGKDAHLVHDELVQTIKWKLARGKFRPNLTNLVQMNTPRVVMQDTKKAFRKLHKTGDLQGAASALCNLKGVGPAMASAVLAAGAPHAAPFMADECLLAMPEVDSLDYTMKEYMRFVEYVNACVERLNSQGGSKWTPHKVELAVWTHSILRDLNPDILSDMPEADAAPVPLVSQNTPSNNGQLDEDTKSSMASSVDAEDDLSNSAAAKNIPHSEETSESMPSASESEVKNGNGQASEQAPKTNGNNSHNGSEENNGAKADEEPPAAENNEEQTKQPNGDLENGINSSEKERTDLSSSSPTAAKRSSPEDETEVVEAVEPASKKVKTCEDAAKTSEQDQPAPAPEVATV